MGSPTINCNGRGRRDVLGPREVRPQIVRAYSQNPYTGEDELTGFENNIRSLEWFYQIWDRNWSQEGSSEEEIEDSENEEESLEINDTSESENGTDETTERDSDEEEIEDSR